jgi:hypothetical protein
LIRKKFSSVGFPPIANSKRIIVNLISGGRTEAMARTWDYGLSLLGNEGLGDASPAV